MSFFSSEARDLAARIEHGLEARFGFAVPTILRSLDELIGLSDSYPFGGAEQTRDQKLYAWFLSRPEIDKLDVPREMRGNYRIVSTRPDAFFRHRLQTGIRQVR